MGAKASHPDQRFGTEIALPCANALCQNCKKLCFLRLYAGVLWRDLVLAFGKARQTLLLQSSQTKGRGVLAAFATLVCQRNCVFLCKGTKAQEFCKAEFLDSLPVSCFTNALCQNSRIRRSRILGIVCRFSPWNAFLPLIPAVWGFGLGLLVRQGFLCAKASLDP